MRNALHVIRFRHGLRAVVAVATIIAWSLSLGIVSADTPPGPPAGAPAGGPPPPPSANVSVFATGLQGPRGLRFGTDGSLYVAEAGMAGTTSTVGQCPQVPNPVGPYTGGKTGRISKISSSGTVTTVANGLPSARDGLGDQSAVIGVADVEWLGDSLYALIEAGGCSHGNPDAPNAILKINADGTWTKVADLSAWAHTNLTKAPPQDDFEPDGSWFSMTQWNGAFYALDANHGDFVKVALNGTVTRVADFSGEPWIGPTTVVTNNGNFYISNLGEFPITPGDAKVWKVTPDGTVSVVATGLEAVLGLAFDSQGRLYALQMSTVPNQGPVPGSGNVVRMTAAGSWETVASGLFFPTAMTFGPDGTLYVSNSGFGPPTGQIVKINVNAPPTAAPTGPPAAAAPVPVVQPTPPSTPPKIGGGAGAGFVRRLGDG